MSKTRLFFYRLLLISFIFHYYVIIEALYLDSTVTNSEKGLATQIIAITSMPLNLLLAIIRLWTLNKITHRLIYFESSYFAIPILTIGFCFAGQIWVAIILTGTAGILTAYELLRNVLKKDFILTKTPVTSK